MSFALVVAGVILRLIALYLLFITLRKKHDWRLIALGVVIIASTLHISYWSGFHPQEYEEMPLSVALFSFIYSALFLFVSHIAYHYVRAFQEKQQALSEHVNLFQQFAFTAPIACFIFQDNKIVFSNQAASALTGYTGSELAQIAPHEIAHTSSKAHILGLSAPSSDETTSFEASIRIKQKNGDTRWGLASFGSANHEGRPASVGTILDVTVHKNAEQSIQAAEERLRLAINASNTVVWDIDLLSEKSRFVVPEVFESDFEFAGGDKLDDIVSKIYPADREYVESTIKKYIKLDEGFVIDYRRFNKKGEPTWWRLDGQAQRDDQGRPVRLTGTARNIHDQKIAEETLRENEARLRLATDIAGIQVWEWDILSNDVIHENPNDTNACAQIRDFEHFFERVHPDHKERIQQSIERSLNEGVRYDEEFMLINNDGQYCWQHSVGQILFDDHGKPVSMIGAAIDTSERRTKDQLIHFQAELLDKIGQSIVMQDATGQITYFNKAASEAFDLDPNSPLPLNIEGKLDARHRIINNPEIMGILKSGQQWAGEIEAHTLAGSVFPIFLSASPLFNEKNEYDGFIGISTNLSALRKVQEALKDSEERLRLAIDAANMVVWEVDLRSKEIVHTTPTHVALDLKARFASIETIIDSIHPDDRNGLQDALDDCTENHKPLYLEHRVLNESGKAYDWWQSSGKLYPNAQGEKVRMIGTSQIITLRKEAELLLQQRMHQLQAIYHIVDAMNKAERLDAVFETITKGITKTLKTDKIAVLTFKEDQANLEYTAGLSEAFGIASLSYCPMRTPESTDKAMYVPDLFTDERFAQMKPYLETEGIQSLAVFPLRSKGKLLGKFVIYFENTSPLDVAEQQLATRIANHIALALQKANAEEALMAKTSELQTIADTIPDSIFRMDKDLQIKFANKAVLESANMSLDEYIASAHSLFNCPEEVHNNWMEQIDKVFATREMAEFDFELEFPGQSLQNFNCLIAPEPQVKDQPETVLVVMRNTTEERRLQQNIIDISARQQRTIGQDLHDELGQLLTGIGFKIASLQHDLEKRNTEKHNTDCALQNREISKLVERAIHQTRMLAEGLNPVTLEVHGIRAGLEKLAANTENTFGVPCPFVCEDNFNIEDDEMAVQVYRIGQEAVNNAVKHSQASKINISLTQSNGSAELVVQDNGNGFDFGGVSEGHGLRIMNYRARVIGATFDIDSAPSKGTTVRCKFKNKVS